VDALGAQYPLAPLITIDDRCDQEPFLGANSTPKCRGQRRDLTGPLVELVGSGRASPS